MLREDVEDERGAVDDLDLDDLFELAQLAGCELAIADHGVGAGPMHDVAELLGLAGADVGRRVRPVTALDKPVENQGACRFGEAGELGQDKRLQYLTQ